jgi:hypothetical protein
MNDQRRKANRHTGDSKRTLNVPRRPANDADAASRLIAEFERNYIGGSR